MSATPAMDPSISSPMPNETPKGAAGVDDAKARFLKRVESRVKSGKYKNSKNLGNKKLVVTLRRALKCYNRMEYADAIKLALEAIDIDSESLQAHQILAISLEGKGELNKAISVYQRAIELDPTDPDSILNLGLLAWKMNLYDVAEKFFRIFLTMKPESPSAIINLAGTLRDQGKADDAVELLQAELFKHPENHELWNSLGSVVMEQGKYEEAVTFYEETLRLAPDYARAHHNMGYTVHHLGRVQDAFDCYNKALDLMGVSPDRAETLHGRSLAMLELGSLEEGLREWEVRNDLSFRTAMHFLVDAPYWIDQDVRGKKLLVMGEQGIGDEIAFANAIPDLIKHVGPEGQVFIAVDKRLVELLQRSFPEAIVGTYGNLNHNGRMVRLAPWMKEHDGCDYYVTMGSTLPHFRKTVEDFPADREFMVPDASKVAHFREELEKLGPGPYVGLCWRSMRTGGNRAKYYSPIEQWGPVMRNKNVTFVNLQYGDCQADIDEAQERYGIKIHQLDLDLKDDLDTNAALCQALDLTIAAPTAAAAISGSVGTETWFVTIGRVWPMLGTDHFPWYAHSRVFFPEEFANWPEAMGAAGEALSEFVGKA